MVPISREVRQQTVPINRDRGETTDGSDQSAQGRPGDGSETGASNRPGESTYEVQNREGDIESQLQSIQQEANQARSDEIDDYAEYDQNWNSDYYGIW